MNYIKSQNRNHAESKLRQAEQVTNVVQDQLDRINEISTHLLYSRWLSRLNNHIGLYDREFDLAKRQETISELTAQLRNLGFVSDILVLVPGKNKFISSAGWFSLEDLDRYYAGLRYEDGIVQSSNEKILPLTAQHSTYSRSSVCAVIDVNRMNRYLQSNTLELFSSYEVLRDDKVITSWTSAAAGARQGTPVMGRMLPYGFQINLTYEPYHIIGSIGNYTLVLIVASLLLLFGLLASFFLAVTTTKPIQAVLLKLVNPKQATVRGYFTQLPDRVDSILTDYNQMTSLLSQYEKRARDEAFFRLLADRSTAPGADEYLKELIPWWEEEKSYQILLLSAKRGNTDELAELASDLIAEHCLHIHTLNLPNCDLSFLYWYEDGSGPESKLRDLLSRDWYTAFSDSCNDLEMASNAYIQAKTRYDTNLALAGKLDESEHLPLSVEIQLVSAILDGDYDRCTKLLSTVLGISDSDRAGAAMRLLARLSYENAVECRVYIKRYNDSLSIADHTRLQECVCDLCRYLCQSIHQAKAQENTNVAILIHNYICENYGNCELSLKHLSQVFQISTTLLSKMFKAENGVNFASFLLDVRLSHAKHMLENTSLSIADISQQVGYENYLSFKRAFIRTEGLSPREFREQNRHQPA